MLNNQNLVNKKLKNHSYRIPLWNIKESQRDEMVESFKKIKNKMLKHYKEILKSEKIKGKEMAEELGLTYESYRTLITGKRFPKWAESFVLGYELAKRRFNKQP